MNTLLYQIVSGDLLLTHLFILLASSSPPDSLTTQEKTTMGAVQVAEFGLCNYQSAYTVNH